MKIRIAKNYKSTGENNISAEPTKYGDKILWEEIHEELGVMWASAKNGSLTGELQSYVAKVRRKINCNVAVLVEYTCYVVCP
jgi:hypothetical protein